MSCKEVKEQTGIRLTSEFRCRDLKAASFDDYEFIIPGALYNHNDTDGDGVDDYLGTFSRTIRTTEIRLLRSQLMEKRKLVGISDQR